MRCFNFFSPQRNFSKESQLETEKVWWGEGVPQCVLNFLSLGTTLMGVKGPMRPHSRISMTALFLKRWQYRTRTTWFLGHRIQIVSSYQGKSVGICLVVNLFLKEMFVTFIRKLVWFGDSFCSPFLHILQGSETMPAHCYLDPSDIKWGLAAWGAA